MVLFCSRQDFSIFRTAGFYGNGWNFRSDDDRLGLSELIRMKCNREIGLSDRNVNEIKAVFIVLSGMSPKFPKTCDVTDKHRQPSAENLLSNLAIFISNDRIMKRCFPYLNLHIFSINISRSILHESAFISGESTSTSFTIIKSTFLLISLAPGASKHISMNINLKA